MPQVHVEHATKIYIQEKKRVPAVENIDLTIEQGEFVFVIGSSGAGKSTLLQMIACEIKPTSGTIYFDGIDMNRTSRFGINRKVSWIGYVPQISRLVRKRTIEENLAMAAILRKDKRGQKMETRIQKALSMVGLEGVGKRYPVELSQGECRRVELARALVNSPQVLILDELTANLDEDTIWDLFHLLGEFNRLGTTIIMATHAKKFVDLMRKRVITLVDGKVLGDVQKGRYGDVV